ncbi:hypothetical protein [Lacticaseibacillus kribbianus]|uniref:hypothetical protein n=1 Tax=Lacticaseibacillus kribbianus TaxID=2926292 RepID=UPI001CD59722|nr:hypothetical protein [Lacticaseibacillus kribbianus]
MTLFDTTIEQVQSYTRDARAKQHADTVMAAIHGAAFRGQSSVTVKDVSPQEIIELSSLGFTLDPISGGQWISWDEK